MKAEKDHLVVAQKANELLPVPSHSSSQRRSKFRVSLTSLIHTLFAVGFIYSIRSWYVGRVPSNVAPSTNDHSWPVTAFERMRCDKCGVLNGECAERIFLKVPDEESAISASRDYASLPHIAGSDQDLVTAQYVLDHFQRNFDIEPSPKAPIFAAGTPQSRNATLNIPITIEPRAWIDTYYPVLNTPIDHSLEILDDEGNITWTADLEEDGDPLDEDASNARTAVPVFHGLSRGGDVTGKVFYANYGRQEDFDEVEKAGVNITGKVALVRYGANFRGLKVKGAQERGAIGTLIYSDPRDDGSVTVENGYEAYPHGPARNPTSVQRGSVQYLSLYPGDPTTPGYPAYENSNRTNGTNIPDIPSLPISWNTAQALFKEIGEGGKAPTVRLVNKVDTKVTPIWNTMAIIPGHIKSEVVVLGNHRDAWVLGAADPSSGTVSVHEIIRGLGVLYRRGWRPLRTILLASWDAEEYGLIGSTEWGEDFPNWIADHVVAYVNIDSSVSGAKFSAQGSPSLAHMLRQAAVDIPHPTKDNRTLWDATSDKGELIGPADLDVVAMAGIEIQTASKGLGVSPLGSGSDYTVFLQRIGVASSNSGFTSTLSDPVYHYHSIYDSQRWQKVYADPGFYRHTAISKYLGLVVLRLADSIVLPMNTTYYSEELASYVDKVEKISKDLKLAVNLSPLRNAVTKLHNASIALDTEKEAAEKQLRHIIKRWHGCHHGHGHHRHGHHGGPTCSGRWRRFNRWVKSVFGATDEHGPDRDRPWEHSHHVHDEEPPRHLPDDNYPPLPPPPHEPTPNPDHPPHPPSHPDHPPHHHWPPHPPQCPHIPHKLTKAVRRVQRVNKKLFGFESGFISKGGIVDREWYKHLGVAPGKWLGYGATTLPGLTEALTIEKNSTLAKHEAERLTTLLTKLTKSLTV